MEEFLKQFPQYEEELIERAAIMEYHGNMRRDEAEKEAVRIVKRKYDISMQKGLFDGE